MKGRSLPPRVRKALVGAFLLVHAYCVLTWVFPGPSAALAFLASPRAPLPTGPGGRMEDRPLVPLYMHLTGQHQGWMFFAPDPLQHNRFVTATVVRRDGRIERREFPRLDRLGVREAWIEKRWRRYQHALIEHPLPAVRADAARRLAREADDPANPPVRVRLEAHESPIPRHDRPSARPASERVKDPSRYAVRVLLDYAVRPEDLR